MSKQIIFTEEEKKQIIYLYTVKKEGAKKIGQKFNCSAPTILKFLKSNNIEINSRKLDLTGQKFGELTVIKPAPPRNDRYTRWVCQCSCGNITEVRTDYLTNGHTKSCGHVKNAIFNTRTIDPGQRFGKLVAIKYLNNGKWLCKCDCGNMTEVQTGNLTNGNTQSCGCLKSKGELKIIQLLTDLNINFKTQYYFEDCKFLNTNRLAFFDFAIFDQNNNLICLIEYDGSQHKYGWSGDENNLQITRERDDFKNQYCQKNNIRLIRISFLDYDKINKEYLLNLIKENNDNE